MKTLNLIKKTSSLVLGLSIISTVAVAEKLSDQILPSNAAVQIHIFKDPTVENQGSTKQFMYVTENGRVVLAAKVSTGKPIEGELSVETAAGTYSIESTRAADFTNPSESWRPATAIIFIQNQVNDPRVPPQLHGQYTQAIHNYPDSGVTGARASHGCVRMNARKAEALVRLLADHGGPNAGVVYVYSAAQQPMLSATTQRAIQHALTLN